jgi:NAD(P)H-nitrite reductase large subunit
MSTAAAWPGPGLPGRYGEGDGHGADLPAPDDPLVCLCSQVTEGEIRAAIRAGHRDLPGIRQSTGANTGCGDCIDDLEEILGEETGG